MIGRLVAKVSVQWSVVPKEREVQRSIVMAHVQANFASRELRAQDGRGDTKVSRYPYAQIHRMAEKKLRYQDI